MSILILGKGYVGTTLEKYLQSANIPCIALSQSELNYTGPQIFSDYLANNIGTIDTVINCSGYTGRPNVDGCETNKELCYNYNVLYPSRVLSVCSQYHIPVIHIGSGCIYTGYDKVYTEDDVPNFGIYSDDSSFYSKCKHIFETIAAQYNCYVFRIRIPFTSVQTSKNYFMKLLNYDTLISEINSITSMNDFCEFTVKFLEKEKDSLVPYGMYNVVNPEPVTAQEVVTLLQQNGFNNPNWRFIKTQDLCTIAKRSNCVLSTQKLKSLGLELPPTLSSLIRDIKALSQCSNK